MREIMRCNSKGMKFIAKGGVKAGNQIYLCECPRCGKIVEMYAGSYYRGCSSCHCLDTKNNRLYSIYTNIKTRCYNPHAPSYCNYGERGIKVCDEWKDNFQAFESWAMSNGYREDLTIDRINNDGNYEPSNCRWTSRDIQNNNKRNNVSVTINGVSKNFKEWCRYYNLNYKSEHSYYTRHGIDMWIERINNR